MTIADNLEVIRHRIGDDVTLVVVTKTIEVARIREVLAAGACELGENRPQELVAKARELHEAEPAPRWHMIGRVQRNKVASLSGVVALWQSVDRIELAEAIAARAPGATVLVQVNVAGEEQKGGCGPSAVPGLVAQCRDLGLAVDGLMTVPPLAGDPVPIFRTVRRLTDDLGLQTCSMGMSNDYEQAVAEGATMVRIGSAVFGPRPPEPDARR
jgi:pyridoxal phosphate enzyme (YggS family)